MASPFGQYQGGIAPISGISEAGANIGKNIQYGYNAFGNSLAEGIQKYTAGVQENEMIDQEAQGLGMQLKQYHDMFANNPEYSDFSKQLSPYVEKLSKLPEMSLAQKRGALNSAKVAFANIGQNLQMYDKFLQMEKVSAMQKTLEQPIEQNLKGESLKYSTPLYIKQALVKFDTNRPYDIQEREFVDSLYKNNQNNPNQQIDVSQALSSYRQAVKDASSELAKSNPVGNVISEQVDSQISRRSKEDLSPAEQMRYQDIVNKSASELLSKKQKLSEKTSQTNVLAGDLNKYLLTKNSKGNLVRNEEYEKLRSNVYDYAKTRNLQNEAENLGISIDKEKLKEAQHLDNKLEVGVAGAIRKTPNENRFWSDIENKIFETRNKTRIEQRKSLLENKDIQSKISEYAKGNFGETGIPSEAIDLATKLGFNREDYGFESPAPFLFRDSNGNITFGARQVSPDYSNVRTFSENAPLGLGAIFAPAQYGELVQEMPSALADFFSRIKEGKINKETGTVEFEKSKQETSIPRKKPIWEKTPEEITSSSVAVSPETSKEKPVKLSLGEINVGSEQRVRSVSREEQNQILRQRFAKILGKKDINGNYVVPNDFDQIMKFFAPSEPVIKYVQGVGNMLQQPDGKWEVIKGQGIQDVRKERTGVYGSINQETGEMSEVEMGIKGSGIMVSGIFTGSDAANDRFQEDMTAFSDARRGLKRMIEVNDKGAEMWSPSLAGEMKTEVANVIAAIRKDVVGGGQVSDYENKLLKDIVADPTRIFSLESSDRAALQALLERTERKILAYGNGRGLNVRLVGYGLTPEENARKVVKNL